MDVYYRVQWCVYRWFCKIYFRLEEHGVEHVPDEGPVLLASNHASHLDPLIVALSIRRQLSTLAKKELFKIPVLNWWIRSVGTYPVDRGGGDAKAMKVAINLLKQGKTLLIFPEGTRSADGNLQSFYEGLAWLSLKTGAPIVPFIIEGSYRAMPRKRYWPMPAKIRTEAGEIITPNEMERSVSTSEGVRLLTDRVYEVMCGMQARLRGAPPLTDENDPPEIAGESRGDAKKPGDVSAES
ncbi:MAG: 1-acylglycerol-3-phosphate O-acyltransferase [bacterium]|nr:1-acylglycerol-3-phosphate O-acyltransferase [bacterium]